MQINSIRPKTGMGDNKENRNQELSNLCAAQLLIWILPSIVNIPEMALEFRCKNVKI